MLSAKENHKKMPMFATFFVYNDWDAATSFVHEYYKCVLEMDMGSFKAGEVFSTVCFDMKKFVLEFYRYAYEDLEAEQILVGVVRLGVI
jgi:hypothetical protein